jgi:hypothetical protein
VRTIATSIAINFDKKYPNENLNLVSVKPDVDDGGNGGTERLSSTQKFETASEQVAHQETEDFDFDGEF